MIYFQVKKIKQKSGYNGHFLKIQIFTLHAYQIKIAKLSENLPQYIIFHKHKAYKHIETEIRFKNEHKSMCPGWKKFQLIIYKNMTGALT